MCGRYAIFTEEENQEIREIINDISERFKEKASNMKTGEIFPTDTVPVITSISGARKTVNLFKWGFPNFRQPGSVIINARSETIHEKPTFRKLLHSGRCIIPASGFYEWRTTNGKKEKYLISSANDNFIYMAGLYNKFTDNTGTAFSRFVILTTDSNEQMSQIHSRMPVILNTSEALNWINSECIQFTDISRLLKPFGESITLKKIS
jgi:putative SOS response-associated peptidase YedK